MDDVDLLDLALQRAANAYIFNKIQDVEIEIRWISKLIKRIDLNHYTYHCSFYPFPAVQLLVENKLPVNKKDVHGKILLHKTIFD